MGKLASARAHRALSEHDRWRKLVYSGAKHHATVAGIPRDYSSSLREHADKPRRGWFGLVRTARDVPAGARVLNRALNGLSVDRFRKILERENCRVETVRFSDDRDHVFIDFDYLSDNGHCHAILTDPQSNGTYVRCCFVAKFSVPMGPAQLNDLNRMSKFLKFYTVDDERMFVEYSVFTVDLPDSAIAANIDLFHGAVNFIMRSSFVYAASGTEPNGPNPHGYEADVAASRHADISRSDLGGIESRLDRIASAMNSNPGRDLGAVVNRLEDIRTLLRDISKKLGAG